jgi:NTP pyrophosphatase (non-canonical NTP hydrolase)
MDLKALQETLRAFASERDWEQFHTPKNLAMALMVETAELMELFQWKTPEESYASKTNKSLQARIGEESADVLLYLLQLVDHTGVDLEYAVHDKLLKNAKKHPVPDAQVVAEQQDLKLAQTHVLVDWENVQPKDLDIRALVPDVTHVWIFHGPTQKRVGDNQQSFGNELTLVPISRSGKNALDFHLSYYVGYISSRNPSARFVVISNDQGYGPMVEHAKELGFAASQLGFGAPKAVAKKTVAKKAPAKKVVANKTAPTKNPVPVNRAPVAKKTTKAAKATTAKTSVAERSAGAPQPAKKAVSGKPKTQKSAKPPAASETGRQPTPAVSKKVLAVDDEKVYSHVLASLRKSKNKPSRKARLFGAVKSLLGVEKVDDIRVERFVQRLVDDGHLVIGANGAVTKTP